MFPCIQIEYQIAFLCGCVVWKRGSDTHFLPCCTHLCAWRPGPGSQLSLSVLAALVASWVLALSAMPPTLASRSCSYFSAPDLQPM